jgi:6-phosphogluconolactonase
MEADAGGLDDAAEKYAGELIRVLGDPPRIDAMLLGVGDDGHVCSLFPNHPLLDEEHRWVAALSDSPKPPASRLTLTLPALAAARVLVLAAFGEAKASAVRAALWDSDSSLPMALAIRRAEHALILLDPAAAAEFSQLVLGR